MSHFAKSDMTVNGNRVNLSMPFAKVNVEKRTVSGYATLDNLDSQGDVVTAEASRKAFSRARGNVREMHEKIAAGRVIDFREEEFFDKDDGQVYRGIWVTAYVSKGAETTWEKVLDGTLTGFSIGGEIVDASNEFVKEAGRTVRFVKDYDLTELSLVDNPANQKANFMSIAKVADGSVKVEGLVAETVIESVFICKNDDTIIVKAEENHLCPVCETKMENAGWFENGPDRTEKVQAIVTKFLSPNEVEATLVSKGGVEEMAKSNKEETHETPTAVDATNADAAEEADRQPNEVVEDEEGEAGEEVVEVEDDSTRLEKKFDEWTITVRNTLEDNQNETLQKVTSLEQRIAEVHQSFADKTSELEEKFNEFGEKLTATKVTLAEFEKALDTINKSVAVRKSGELSSSETRVQKSAKSIWGGTFSGESLF